MKLTFAFITNYKSIRNRQKLLVDDKVTVIIGKNESGKSNIIDILGEVNLTLGIKEEILKITSVGSDEDSCIVEVEFMFNEVELKKINLNNEYCKSYFTFSNNTFPNNIKIGGGISEYFKNDKYKRLLEQLNQIIIATSVIIKDVSQKQDVKNRYKLLSNASSYIIANFSDNLNIIHQRLIPFIENELSEDLNLIIGELKDYFSNAYSIFPTFHKLSNSTLKSQYTMNKDFFDKLDSQNVAIKNLIAASGSSIDEWRSAMLDDRLNSKGIDAKNKILEGIKALEVGFNQFYNQEEHVKIVTNMDSTVFQLYIDTSGNSIAFTERSNGLQWYLNLYIELLSNRLVDKPVIYLIDEPGVFLHVDAQKEVLQLFDFLTIENNQIIYTTHSPFMINESKSYRIRPIQKYDSRDTLIFQSIQSDKIEVKSRVETLSPLLEAIGMKQYQNIGMVEDTIHIVTEGISDAIYMNTMIEYFQLANIKAIPSRGASNVIDMTFILWGLGYSFKTLYDQDKAGKDGANEVVLSYTEGLLEKEVNDFKQKYIFMVTDAFDNYDQDRNYTIESLIDSRDYKVLNSDYSYEHLNNSKSDKILLSKYFCDAFYDSPNEISSDTKKNFKRLLTKIIGTGL